MTCKDTPLMSLVHVDPVNNGAHSRLSHEVPFAFLGAPGAIERVLPDCGFSQRVCSQGRLGAS